MKKGALVVTVVAGLLLTSLVVSRAYFSHRAHDPATTSKRKMDDCFSIARQLMKAPSQTTLVKAADLNNVVSLTLEAPNAFGVKLRSEVTCEMEESTDLNLAGYYTVSSAKIDGKPVSQYDFAMASSNAVLEKK